MAEEKSASTEGQSKRTVEDEPKATSLTEAQAKAALSAEKPEPEKEAEPEKTSEYEPRGEAEKLPWDLERQARDQTRANVTKELKAIRTELRELREAKAKPEHRSIKEITKAMDDLETINDDLSDDDERKAYQRNSAKLRTELNATVAALEDAAKPDRRTATEVVADDEKAAEEEPEKKETPGASQDDFYSVLDAADKEYGGKFRKDAVKEILRIFKERGYVDNKSPTKDVIEDIALRVYADLSGKAAVKAAEEAAKKKKADAEKDAEPAPSGLTKPEVGGQRKPGGRKAWAKKERQKRKAEGRR